MRIARLAVSLIPLTLFAAASPAAAGTLLPHRAVYDLQLDNASDRSGITGISGRMVYEFDGSACDGYTVTFRFVTRMSTDEVSRLTDQQTTTYEEGHGDSFTFVTRSFIDQKLDKELKGTAKRTDDNTSVSIEKPEARQMALDRTQFPTEHLLELLDKARSGETFYETTLYDASDDADKVMTTTVIIGNEAEVKPTDTEFEVLGALGKAKFWPVDVAYFDLSEGDEVPTYRISFKLHESGLTRDLVMDYGDFSMKGTLVDLAMYDAPEACSQ